VKTKNLLAFAFVVLSAGILSTFANVARAETPAPSRSELAEQARLALVEAQNTVAAHSQMSEQELKAAMIASLREKADFLSRQSGKAVGIIAASRQINGMSRLELLAQENASLHRGFATSNSYYSLRPFEFTSEVAGSYDSLAAVMLPFAIVADLVILPFKLFAFLFFGLTN
jgi:hypothetical protein